MSSNHTVMARRPQETTRLQMLFSFKKRTRPHKLLSSGKLNGSAQLLKVMVLITAVVYQLFKAENQCGPR